MSVSLTSDGFFEIQQLVHALLLSQSVNASQVMSSLGKIPFVPMAMYNITDVPCHSE